MDDPLGTAVTNHFHGDMIGSMRMMTDGSSGDPVAQGTYTAFGELRPGSSNERYGYAGAWGHQTDAPSAKDQRAALDSSEIKYVVVGSEVRSPAQITLDIDPGKMYWTDWGTRKIQSATVPDQVLLIVLIIGRRVWYDIRLAA